jgi:hypothetical protein
VLAHAGDAHSPGGKLDEEQNVDPSQSARVEVARDLALRLSADELAPGEPGSHPSGSKASGDEDASDARSGYLDPETMKLTGDPPVSRPRVLPPKPQHAISIIAAIAGLRVSRAMVAPHGAWTAGLLAGLTYVAIVAVAQLMMPAVNEVSPGFPATVLWRFRIASLGTQLVLWSTIGIGFGFLAERVLQASLPNAYSKQAR